ACDRVLALEASGVIPHAAQRLGAPAQCELVTLGGGARDRILGGAACGLRLGEGVPPALVFGEPARGGGGGREPLAAGMLRLPRELELGLGTRALVVGQHRDRERGALTLAQ